MDIQPTWTDVINKAHDMNVALWINPALSNGVHIRVTETIALDEQGYPVTITHINCLFQLDDCSELLAALRTVENHAHRLPREG